MLCADGYYIDGTTCKGCNPACSQCTGPSISECSGCVNNYYLEVNTCKLCDVACDGCTAGGKTDCIACNT